MTHQKPPGQKVPPNPAISELQAIRQELTMIRRDLNTQKRSQPIDEATQKPEQNLPLRSVVFKIALGVTAMLSFGFCNSAGSQMTGLRSEAGNSLAEIYYQSMGTFVIGLSFFLGMTLLYFAYLVPPVGFALTKKKN